MTTTDEATHTGGPSLFRRLWRIVAGNVSSALLWPRLQLAMKAGLAAGVAFAIAPLMPGSAADYPYYAPLGALVAMYENVAGSMKQGVQTLAGLAIGIGLAFVLFILGSPSPLTVGIVMAFGVVLAGLPKIGAGRDWIPTAALLVLLVGGHNPDTFSFGYLFQMGVGVTVGIIVNLLVFPPLHFRAAELSIAELRLALAQQLRDMATALKESWPPEHEDWSKRSDSLEASARSVRLAVEKADASRRANPRRRLHPRDIELDYRNLRDLERVTFHVQDVTQVLSDVIWAEDTPFVVPDEYTEPLADAMSAVADILRSIEEESPQEQLERIEAADSAVKALTGRIGAGETATDAPSAAESILMSLHRMLRVVKSSSASD
ncbi:Aromatic acid exporter family member 1 [Arthrobacter sp. ok909]|uniref:FUSC family protein n=1 Tax=Arthrobacter sp. ok909 TaxID=1761746 RepID=UPI00088C295B|nr:aromatic acid exporter family protein [Arthrobacter sp. ok909]SDP59895.1 Aromatic acid exporter family member 1 [Arthrobacter sp. ok909]